MNQKTIIGILIAAVIVLVFVWAGRPISPDGDTASLVPNSPSMLVAEEAFFDFGKISMAAGNVSHPFMIKNNGVKDVIVDKIYTSCMCTTAVLKTKEKTFGPYGMLGHGAVSKIDESLKPGEEAVVEVIFDPAAHGPAGLGQTQRAIFIENNSGQPLELRFNAVVTP